MDAVRLDNELVSRCGYCGVRIRGEGFFLRPGVRLCSRECLQYFMEQESEF